MSYQMFFMLGGGLGLFLFGMNMMGNGLERTAGNRMKRLLEILTTNRLMGVLVGFLVTAIIQSSSATTVMVIGFVNAGLMNLAQATGVIMGANIGTTITAQIVALELTEYAPIAVFIGVGLILFAKKRYIKHIGEIIAGFGILFMGMDLMSTSMKPLRDNEAFHNILMQISNPFLGVIVGVVSTAVLQSSSASIGILQALAMQGLIDMDTAIYILFGQNIGTCVTAILASIGTGITAKRAAGIHLIFNIMGTALFIILINLGLPYVEWIEALTPGHTVRQIANAHTGFNVINTIITLPVAGYLPLLASKLVPGEEPEQEEMRLKFLDKRILETPPIAVAQIMNEVGRMADIAQKNLEEAMDMVISKDDSKKKDVLQREEVLNFLNREITSYLVEANGLELPEKDLQLIGGLFHVVNDIERIGDHSENIIEYAEYLIEHNLTMSDMAIEELTMMKDKVMTVVNDTIKALKNKDRDLARTIRSKESAIDELERILRENHIDRLNKQLCEPSCGVVFLDIVNNLERISDHADNIARFVLD